MKWTTEAAAAGVVAVLGLTFFFAPVVLVTKWNPPFNTGPYPIYGSASCVIVGFGDTYAPNAINWQRFHLGCNVPPQPNWNSTLEGGSTDFLFGTAPTVAPNDRISLPSGVGVCSSNCIYPRPYLSAMVSVNTTSPLVSLHLFINGTDEGIVGSFNNTITDYGYVLKANPHNPSLPVQAGKTYHVELVAAFRDGDTSTAAASTVAS